MTKIQIKQTVEALAGLNRKEWNAVKRAVDMEFEKTANKCELIPENCELAAKNVSDELVLSDNLDT